MFCQLEWHWETQECCTIHHLGAFIKKKIHWCSRGRESERYREQKTGRCVCVCVCVLCKYLFFFFKDPQGLKVREVFYEHEGVIDRLMGVSTAL